MESISTINKSWFDAKMVMTSPINTIGCSYSVENDFDNVFVNAMPKIQMIDEIDDCSILIMN
jgi:hypothetical protein